MLEFIEIVGWADFPSQIKSQPAIFKPLVYSIYNRVTKNLSTHTSWWKTEAVCSSKTNFAPDYTM